MTQQSPEFTQDIVALIYDFDGTLSPQPMQDYTVLPMLGIKPAVFWEEVNRQSDELGEESMLTYMRLLLEKAEQANLRIDRDEFKKLGREVKYFRGVETWFNRINHFVTKAGSGRVNVRHYIISAGLKEIIDGISVRKHFHNVFASEYHYNLDQRATFPKLLVTDTTKTQFLFRINKGKEKLTESINTHMPDADRPIPFGNVIYIGDGETDVPSMAVTRQNGGNAIAVFKAGKSEREMKTQTTCKELLAAGRVNFIAPADYSSGSILEKRVHILLRSVIAKIEYERELFSCNKEYGLES